MRFIIQTFFVTFALLLSASCKLSDKRMGRFYSILMHAKKESISRWDSKTSLPVIGLRTGMILSGKEFITFTNSHITSEGHFRLHYRVDKVQASKVTIGSAVPITKDGYYLTARHCVDDDSDTLAAFAIQEGSMKMVKTDFRVVWSSDEKSSLDMALIHANIQPFRPFRVAHHDSISVGNLIGAAGWSALTVGESNPMAGLSVGELLSIKQLRSSALQGQWKYLRHTAPLHPGDSGGPLVNEQGELIGINEGVRIAYVEQARTFFTKKDHSPIKKGYIGLGAYPDMDIIAALIEEDRKTFNQSMLSVNLDKD